MSDARLFTNADKADAAERELGKRRHVYPRLIEAGKLTRHKADREIAVMEAIWRDYAALAEKDRLI